MALVTLRSRRRSPIVGKQYCSKCDLFKDHVLLRRWTEGSGDSDTYIRAETWVCCYCDTIQDRRSEERKPTEEVAIIKRLIKLSSDYDQIKHSTLEVRGDMVILSLKLFPWAVVQAAKRVEQAKERGFFWLGDLWRLQQYGLLKGQLEDKQGPSVRQQITKESRAQVATSISFGGGGE